MANGGLDPFTLQVINHALLSVADEMAVTVVRTSRSHVTKHTMDFSTGICDREGRLVAQGTCVPFHMGAFPYAMKAILDKFEGRTNPGDVFILNDPFQGGMHLPDVYLVKPVFTDGELAGFTMALSHFASVGGRIPGSQASDNTDIYQEGICIPPLKLYEAGQLNDTLMEIFLRNGRTPELALGDTNALLAACHAGEEGLHRLIGRYGLENLNHYLTELLDYTERLARQEIRKWPKGTAEFVDYLDNDGVNPDPIRLQARVTIDDSEVSMDFSGSSGMVKGAYNASLPSTLSTAYYVVRHLMEEDVPVNSGFYRPIHVYAPPDSILNATYPSATGVRGLTAIRQADAIFGALAQLMPSKVFAAGEGGNTHFVIAGRNRENRQWVMKESIVGCWGGRPYGDGLEGVCNPAGNTANAPVELVEADYPGLLRIEEYGFQHDTGGAGKYRGGLAIKRSWRLLAEGEALLQVNMERHKFAPWGLQGGQPGTTGHLEIIHAEGSGDEQPGKVTTTIRSGDLVRFVQASAGGWGDPKGRDRQSILEDLANEKLSPAYVRENYSLEFSEEEIEDFRKAAASSPSV